MKIVRLELFGFKSFKDKTLITFNQPITAIVGSNGCGKSNVVDALYWVMGDMSPKHLRGSVMTDVIFSGSKDSAPMDVAEVTLVLERNPEIDPELPPQFQASTEIQITRRYYRSGDSEYLINKTLCRLRDIQEFFMDTGVGAKAYSIVEQGAISRMISLKPEDRRVVIEEVAGIMKFKARKAETERKIENSQANLQRLDDIVQDLQKQLGSLKRQADRAEKFKDLSAELKDLELRLASREWINRSDKKDEALFKITTLKESLDSLEGKLGLERERFEASQTQLNSLEDALSQKRDETRRLELTLKDSENDLKARETRRENFEHRIGENQNQLEEIAKRSDILTVELNECETQVSLIETEISKYSTQLESQESEAGQLQTQFAEIENHLNSIKKEIHGEEISQTRTTQNLQTLQRQVSQLQSRSLQLEDQIQLLGSENDLLSAEQKTTLSSLEIAFATRKELESAKLGVDEKLSTLEKEKTDRLQTRERFRQDLAIVRVKKEQLEALDRNLEGVDSASRAVALSLRAEGKSECLLADKVRIPSHLEKALEAALGRNLERIITTSENSFEKIFQTLENSDDPLARQSPISLWAPQINSQSQSSLSRLDEIFVSFSDPSTATEIPQEVPGPDGLVATPVLTPLKTLKTYLLDHPQVIGPMNSILHDAGVSGEWLPLVENFWVVRDRAALLEISQKIENLPVGLVSLEGDRFDPLGLWDLSAIEPKSTDGSLSLISRKRLTSELFQEETQLQIEFEKSETDLDFCLKAISTAKEEFRDLTHKLASLDPDVHRHNLFLREVETKLARISEKLKLQEEDLESTRLQSNESSLKIDELQMELTTNEETLIGLRGKLESLGHDRNQLLGQTQSVQAGLTETRNQIKVLEKDLAQFQSQRAALRQEESLQKSRNEQLDQEIARLRVQIGDLESEIETGLETLKEHQALATEAAGQESELLNQVQSSKAGLRGLQAEVEKLSQDLNLVQHELKDLDQEIAIQEIELKNISERIENSYQVRLIEIERPQLEDMSKASDLEEFADNEAGKRLAHQLRQKIDNLGKINMVAVEEFEDVRRRHEYLFIQREDLSQALAQLRDAIARIDRESKDRFGEAFVAVNQAFQKTFPLLFGGGSAELKLTQPENLLETGVEIIAQPPGKKLQNVTLLSGGEKALTAVSLIFGIFSIKPSPFCVLDEVDAPLDDANVGRFNNLVRQITDRSQVIMITHHKKTMESADALFGVTMEKPGISKLASVRIGELKD